ncbi:MAG: tRNA 2-selenouridine(34) synthase MnmH [Arenimonas sp.]
MGRNAVANISELETFDVIIDVRTPAEFALDHLPGAINCPVLSNEERVMVGTLYKQVSPFAARQRGAQFISRNIAQHLEQEFEGKPKDWQPLIYCWRGGMRSGAMVHILRQVGWSAAQLHGGYQAFRRHVVAELESLSPRFRYVVLCGKTGSGKTRLLEALDSMNAQVLDLEKLAEHRGSVLGAIPDQTQPSQKRFETLLWQKLQSFDSSKPVFVEAESRKIGSVALPVTFAAAMQNKGQLITVETPFSSRVKLLIDGYQHFLADPAAIKLLLEHLLSLRGRETINRWRNLADQGEWKTLVEELLEQHYDPSYLRSAKMRAGHYAAAQTIELDNLETNTLANAAKQLMAIGT